MAFNVETGALRSSIAETIFYTDVPFDQASKAASSIVGCVNTDAAPDRVSAVEAQSLTGSKRSEVAAILAQAGVGLSPEMLVLRARELNPDLPGGTGLAWAGAWTAYHAERIALGLALLGAGVFCALTGSSRCRDY